jgi:hypothetical protein
VAHSFEDESGVTPSASVQGRRPGGSGGAVAATACLTMASSLRVLQRGQRGQVAGLGWGAQCQQRVTGCAAAPRPLACLSLAVPLPVPGLQLLAQTP